MSSSFDESVEKYRSFLESNGYSPNTVWITPRDVLVCDRPSVYVKIPVPAENAEQARELFECRISQQKGVLFKTTCASKDATFIHAWVPRDEDEAQRHLNAERSENVCINRSEPTAGTRR